MFTTGIPALSLSFFSAASMAVAIPSGIQVFAWIATIAAGRLRLATPSLFVLGFLFIFTLGGLTGVMVAMVPFDWQVHDTYFVVAHFHYVLIGGMVFPLFAAFYYWAPAFSRRALSERLGQLGVLADVHRLQRRILPDAHHRPDGHAAPRLHLSGRDRMGRAEPDLHGRRLHVRGRRAGLPRSISSRNLRPTVSEPRRQRLEGRHRSSGCTTTSTGRAASRWSTSRDPLWDQPGLARGRRRPGATTCPARRPGARETIVTSPIEATPQYLLRLPGPGWSPLLAAVFTAGVLHAADREAGDAGARSAASLAVVDDPGLDVEQRSASRRAAPRSATASSCRPMCPGPLSHSWWAMVVLMLVAGSLYLSYVFSYLYLWTVSPQVWPQAGAACRRRRGRCCPALLLAASSGADRRWRPRAARRHRAAARLFVAADRGSPSSRLPAGSASKLVAHWRAGLRPDADAHAAMVYMASFLQLQLVLALVVMAGFAIARRLAGMLNRRRRVVFDNLALLWHYTVAQGLLGLLLVHGFPRIAG